MDFPYTKGIIRPNAQCLSISLSPLVAQRSLLFRVQTDLRVKADYSQLSSSDISSTLWTMSAIPSNVAMSTGTRPKSSAISTSSVYSQDSWKSPPPPVKPVNSDVRRFAIALSPSVEREEQKPDEELTLTTPVQSAHLVDHRATSASGGDHPIPDEDSLASEYNKWKDAKEQEGGRKKLKKVHPTTPKRASRSSKAFGKVLARLSIQPSAKRAAKRQTIPALSPIFQLPEVQMSPIHIPIPASPTSSSISEQLALPLSARTPPDGLSTPPKQARKASEDDFKLQPAPPYRRIHKRYPSSPAILGWNPKTLPTEPVPKLPSHILESKAPRSRCHSIAGGNSEPVPPLPVHAPEQDHNPIDRLRQLRSEIALSKLGRPSVSTTLPNKGGEADFKLEPAPPSRRVHKRYPSSPAILGWNPKNLPTAPVPKLPAHILESTAARSRCHSVAGRDVPLLPVRVSEQDHNSLFSLV